jgi:hypothetical protein
MQNAHLRLGRLEYQRSSGKTNTHISVHVSHYAGEKEQAHLLSFFGNDAEVAAVRKTIDLNSTFRTAPNSVSDSVPTPPVTRETSTFRRSGNRYVMSLPSLHGFMATEVQAAPSY